MVFGICIAISAIWYTVPQQIGEVQLLTVKSLILFMLWLLYAIGAKSRLMGSRVMKYFGGISMEMYLAQMVVFRVIEKSGLLYILGYGWLSFSIVMVLEIGILVIAIEAWKIIAKWIKSMLNK